ncbi:MAG: ABC transporter ATP-binding protein [Theionarchaea archaeon]|nr:ABC transporter ATP-binding protein [Theionarchaea archaeon]MBU7000246.1 ABC transporter ATP-binding protein [Theionarchaea archaeon]MBU7022047.1 ABC transporter ATP-binding protein [Theionarchaea archaeon]MBU7034729.1 ABC transporter ATP-binding protein [Theionarchaea archaeon]MBU7041657.1 ABC transporter ATP-binding protein [Theionarchaea archaeon]
MAIIETEDLTRTFDTRQAVQNLTMHVEKGEVLGFLGPNGAGKTTTVRMLSGIISPTAGHATVAGFDVSENVDELHEHIGLLTETPGFYERLSAWENLLYFGRFYAIDAESQAAIYLKRFGLWERRNDKVGTFSKGMSQRLALARALLHEPDILFLDEPTAGLDPKSAREVRDLIMDLKKMGRTVFLCTHNLEEAELLCDRIAVFQTRLIAMDTPENLRSSLFRREVVVELESLDDAILTTVQNLDFVETVKRDKTSLILELQDFDRNRPALVRAIVEKNGNITSVFEKKHTLEDVYLTLTREEEEL